MKMQALKEKIESSLLRLDENWNDAMEFVREGLKATQNMLDSVKHGMPEQHDVEYAAVTAELRRLEESWKDLDRLRQSRWILSAVMDDLKADGGMLE